jgi:hypothetical protein
MQSFALGESFNISSKAAGSEAFKPSLRLPEHSQKSILSRADSLPVIAPRNPGLSDSPNDGISLNGKFFGPVPEVLR